MEKTAIVTLNSNKDLEEFFRKFQESYYPKFWVEPYIDLERTTQQIPNMMQGFHPQLVQRNNMVDQFGNMSLLSKIY